MLQFKAKLIYGEADCEHPQGSKVISWFVVCETGGWQSEFVTPVYGEGANAWKWYSFTATYTVKAADINNPKFCFTLYARSGCWGTDRPYNNTKKCPLTKLTIPHIRLQKYFNCKLIPGCTACLKLDLAELIQSIGNPVEQVQVVLLRNGKQVAVLGQAGPGRKLPAQVQIKLPAADANITSLKQATGFQVKVLGGNGQVLASEEVTLKIN